jgi:hypothetical protein
MTGQERNDLLVSFTTGDCLIEVTTSASLTVLTYPGFLVTNKTINLKGLG